MARAATWISSISLFQGGTWLWTINKSKTCFFFCRTRCFWYFTVCCPSQFRFPEKQKIPAWKLISFLVSQGSSSTRVEIIYFWGWDSFMQTASAISQQRLKLKLEALEAVFQHFNSPAMELPHASFKDSHYRFLDADGSTCTFFSTQAFSSHDYYCKPRALCQWCLQHAH